MGLMALYIPSKCHGVHTSVLQVHSNLFSKQSRINSQEKKAPVHSIIGIEPVPPVPFVTKIFSFQSQ